MFTVLEKEIKKHVTVSPEDFEKVKRHFVPKKVRKKQFLLEPGEIASQLAFVEKGALYSYSISEKGSVNVVQFAFEAWWMADLYSFFTQEPSKLMIEALEDSELLVLRADNFQPLLHDAPALESYFRILYQNAYVALQRRIEATIGLSAEERYKHFADEEKHILQRVPQHLIASFLGVTPETLSRIRRQIL